jgi:hypothetical protein
MCVAAIETIGESTVETDAMTVGSAVGIVAANGCLQSCSEDKTLREGKCRVAKPDIMVDTLLEGLLWCCVEASDVIEWWAIAGSIDVATVVIVIGGGGPGIVVVVAVAVVNAELKMRIGRARAGVNAE